MNRKRTVTDLLGHRTAAVLLSLGALFLAATSGAQETATAPVLSSGDTAWMLTSTLLVLFMTIPGLALFYGGLVRRKNVLSVLMQCFAITAMISVMWGVYLYSLAFDTDGMADNVRNLNSFFGSFGKAFLNGVDASSMTASIPENVFIIFQLTFAIITPALIVGAFAERMKFSAMLLFTALWSTLVYAPVAHMAWAGPGGLFWDWGVLDFAGGTVVHINAGIAALVACLLIGRRRGFPSTPMPPHSMTLTLIGAAMLWVGWFGFNAGSAVAANASAGNAMLVTHMATATAALTWMFIEWVKNGKPSALGISTGAVAGLVAITPASGSCGFPGALVIGSAAAVCCYLGATTLKKLGGYDDSLDAFGVHGIGGIVGAILTGVCASPLLNGQGLHPLHVDAGVVSQLIAQIKSVLVTLAWSGIVSFLLLKAIDLTIGLRVSAEEEEQGLDLALHGEEGYNL